MGFATTFKDGFVDGTRVWSVHGAGLSLASMSAGGATWGPFRVTAPGDKRPARRVFLSLRSGYGARRRTDGACLG